MGLDIRIVNDSNLYDVLIVGGGPSCMAACIYLCRAGLKVGYIEKNVPGGRLVNIANIENYPGFSRISGPDLALKMYEQVDQLGAVLLYGEVTGIDKYENYQVVYTNDGATRYCYSLIIASGTVNNKLEAINADKYENRGVSYCAICDGSLAKGKDVVVIGGGNSALSNAIYLAKIANNVHIIHRRDQFRGDDELVKQLAKYENIHLVLDSVVEEVVGNEKQVTGVKIKNVKTNAITDLSCSFVFIYIGSKPSTGFIKDKTMLNENGYIIHNEKMETPRKGVYAIGDVSQNNYNQISQCIGEGTIAALNIMKYLDQIKK